MTSSSLPNDSRHEARVELMRKRSVKELREIADMECTVPLDYEIRDMAIAELHARSHPLWKIA